MLFATLAGLLSARRLIPVLLSNYVFRILGVLDCVLGCGVVAVLELLVLIRVHAVVLPWAWSALGRETAVMCVKGNEKWAIHCLVNHANLKKMNKQRQLLLKKYVFCEGQLYVS